MPPDRLDRLRPSLPLGLAPFAGQSRAAHTAAALAGVAAFLAAYAGSAALLFGGLDALAPGGPRLPALAAGTVGSVACWLAFAAAFVRGYGGPVLNPVVYPLATVAAAPTALRWALFGPDVAALRDRVGLFLFDLEPVVTAVALVVPGVGAFALAVGAWAARLDEPARREWEAAHLDPAFREAFADAGGDGSDPDR